MRIVGGSFKGRVLKAPRSASIRPTTDRTREALFNILTHTFRTALKGRRMLELFAGTGAVGLEALSRGADFVAFVEQSTQGQALLRQNIALLGVERQSRVFRRDATALGRVGSLEPFDLLFADPPYGHGLGESALQSAASGGWLKSGALVILEERSDIEPKPVRAFRLTDRRDFGDTAMHFFFYDGVSAED
ncbi:MAG: 16S rRNA (guanine(966)-N(2))-methyltransferase RsmD [Pseudomonadota bacterium]